MFLKDLKKITPPESLIPKDHRRGGEATGRKGHSFPSRLVFFVQLCVLHWWMSS
jgi:hypothetical protein